MENKFLIAVLFLATACSGTPEPPQINPFAIVRDPADENVNHLNAAPCRMTDPKEFAFKCKLSDSSPLNRVFLGYIMISPQEFQYLRAWGKDIVENYECKKK